MERGWKPNVEISPNCPRCGSPNTKFCYYNNYSLTQPRYFCKGCRRYWTKGGSLRNVPVGGGCRKNRRGKSLRLPIDHGGPVPSSRSLACGVVSTESSMGHNSVNSNMSESSSSSAMSSDGSHIDLALVYANFLNNHQPGNNKVASSSGFEMPDLLGEFDPSLEFPSLSSPNIELGPEENDRVGCLPHHSNSADHLSVESHLGNNRTDHNHQMYYPGLESSVHKHQHHQVQDRVKQITSHETNNIYGLPPLPGEELSSQEMFWSNSHMMLNHTLQAPEEQDPNLLFNNWSPFDLSSDVTFSRT